MIKLHSMERRGPNWAIFAGIRFLLAIIVAMAHIAQAVGDGQLDYFRVPGPFSAVMVFLIISGFSVSASYSRQPEGFYRRRFWRIYPLYFLGTLASTVPFLLYGQVLPYSFTASLVQDPWDVVVRQLLLLQPAITPPPAANSSLWSMGVEECYYLLLPFLTRVRSRYLALAIPISLALYVVTDTPVWAGIGKWMHLSVFWAFAGGVLLFRHWDSRRARAALLSLPTVAASITYHPTGWAAPLVAAASGVLIYYSGEIRLSKNWSRALEYLGDLSFPLYVIHFPIAWLVCFQWWDIQSQSVLLLSLVVSVILLHTVDRPLRRLGRRDVAPRDEREVAIAEATAAP